MRNAAKLTPGSCLGLDPIPVRGQLRRGPRRRQRAHRADSSQRHTQTAQPGHQPGLLELGPVIEPVLRQRVDIHRAQQAELVIQPQRLPRNWPFCAPAPSRLATGSEGRADAWLVRLPSKVAREAKSIGGNQ